MTLRLPTTLATDSNAAAVTAPTKYNDRPYLGDNAYVGAHFDSWPSTGNRAGEADRFTADDLVAAGVPVRADSPTAAREILVTQGRGAERPSDGDRPGSGPGRRTGLARPTCLPGHGLAGDLSCRWLG
ncbi:DUF6308 family protein [Rhodococcus koreensis]|uniref:DUF6308 family protein n=1 Tax=Rhodococcus koreensis TaxID=99653 RepID=UPI001F126358|nr:DUF6308 family protein [Rhodococcus koreensis]